jgi:hypothetical protein
MLSGCGCSNRQGVDSGVHEIAKGQIDHPLAFDTVFAGERLAFNSKAEVALAGRVIAAVAAMLLAVIRQFDAGRRKRRVEAGEHFSRDRASFFGAHWAYI